MTFSDTVPYGERGQDHLQVLRDEVRVNLPVQIVGLPSKAKLRDPHVAVEISGGDVTYASPWQSTALSEHAIGVLLPKAVLDRFAAVDAKVHLELVAEELLPTSVKRTTVGETFAGPMNGVCGVMQGKVICRYPYREWTPARVEMEGCGDRSTVVLRHVPAGTTPDPVVNEVLPFERKACTGGQLIVTEYATSQEIRLEADAANVRLAAYVER